MKNLYLLILLFIGVAASAQSPEKMSYQAVLRDANGEILKNQSVSIQFSVLQTSISGTSVYQEDHKLTTNSNGLVSVHIGTGTVSSGDFSIIDWSKGPYFLKSEIDPTGGSNYTISSTTELVSVPYAMYASKAEFADSLIGGLNFVDLTTNQTVDGEKIFNNDLIVNGITLGKGGGSILLNTAIGNKALNSNTTGSYNTASGAFALQYNTTGNNNTANGYAALVQNTTGSENTATGFQALFNNTTGSYNTAIGNQALQSNTTGSYNTVSGSQALQSNTTGINNTASGFQALFINSTGRFNTATGFQALFKNTTGSYNTAIGNQAISSNTTGSENIALGYKAIRSNTTGSRNIAIGNQALFSNTTGGLNIAIGDRTLPSNTTGGAIIAIGSQALRSNTTGGFITAIGNDALYYNTTGSENIAIGPAALYVNTTGFYNTAIGFEALKSNTTGSNNTAIGRGADVSSSNKSNATAIGYGAIVSASNTVRIGNTSVSRIEGQVAWSNTSDGRIKENVQEAVPGLSFISELRPVTYTLNTKKQDEITMQAMPDSIKEKRMLSDEDYLESSSIVRTGFIAQEVEAAAQKVGFDFDGVSAPENETDLYGIRYAEFVVPLVKAVQEQQEMITELKTTEEEQQATIDAQQTTIEQQRNDYLLLLERIEALEKE